MMACASFSRLPEMSVAYEHELREPNSGRIIPKKVYGFRNFHLSSSLTSPIFLKISGGICAPPCNRYSIFIDTVHVKPL